MKERLELFQKEFDSKVPLLLENLKNGGDRFKDAYQVLAYSLKTGGKRFRPFLVDLVAGATGHPIDEIAALRFGFAVELIHQYSLVHDDLPCMDHGVMRHGQRSVHLEFGEARAVLAGDAMLTWAFEVLSTPTSGVTDKQSLDAIRTLSHAAGVFGMVNGQFLDMAFEAVADQATNKDSSYCDSNKKSEYIADVQKLKTGALITASFELGAILGKASATERKMLVDASQHFGVAYQIQDDYLDRSKSPAEMGKLSLKDDKKHKLTYLSANGGNAEEVKTRFTQEYENTLTTLKNMGKKWESTLGPFVEFVRDRQR